MTMTTLLLGAAEAAAGDAPQSALAKLLPELAPLGILLAVILIVVFRLPKIDVGHSDKFRHRRLLNWLPLGLTYSFLYMGRYNLEKAKEAFKGRMGVDDFSLIFGVGALVYGVSFIINGPLTDRIGGRKTIMIAACGAAAANFAMGFVSMQEGSVLVQLGLLYGVNMYFQSFGAVAIVKVNAPWFHVRERGIFGAIFGILISLGVYFAYDWSKVVIENVPLQWVFWVPACILLFFAALDYLFVRDSPSKAGLEDFDPGDAQLNETGQKLPVWRIFKLALTNKIILLIIAVEFCSGFLRQAIMQFYPVFVASTYQKDNFIFQHWGIFLCCAGILGGMVAGIISDRVFQSRRGPVVLFLYTILFCVAVGAVFGYQNLLIMGPLAVLFSMAVIGVHGMLSGTASMDFGGRANTGVVVGIIDGFVYLGTACMAGLYSVILPTGYDAAVVDNWWAWPVAMVPVALLGALVATRLWNAKPTRAGAAH